MYIPMKHAGFMSNDFWIGTKTGIPHWQAYLEAAADYGLDAWPAPGLELPMIYEEALSNGKSNHNSIRNVMPW